ncbi:hypothetical protein GGTG_12049 [Gaeumannomyces tritici R3-111a-1]|uniref:FAD-binding domain-containing protein n=1 Tax=Gaeumannomyces tritici (strain R3-111a-1) TaxID=644352 RepID=J3PEX0_GAET3|nr:hypothetical protein GGTG_12049 [Gaeumannomyces tritici R3-111a-1]EJT71028.1 hypothetical protein GGTG_12049 [Gaeumannomyces tritici R3-111a-1]
MATKEHQVVIVGGGITGLAMALMLEKLDVDYVLLEAYKTITPNLGASIGLLPHGERVLDQLGCWDALRERSMPFERVVLRDGVSGRRVRTWPFGDVLERRHGYPSVFTSRYELLCVMHERVRDKHRILTETSVERVETHPDHALVRCAGGGTIRAQVVVGADGVHSTVRREMWRNADEAGDEGWIPARDRAPVPVEYGCVFGTASKRPRALVPGETVLASGPGLIATLMSGPDGTAFFFNYWELPKDRQLYELDKLPRFTEKDKAEQTALGGHLIISDGGATMGEMVAEAKSSSGVTSIPVYLMRRWHHGRLVILGDAAHKFNPLTGMGGNGCLDSCAALVSELHARGLLGPDQKDGPWPLASVSAAFAATEAERVPRLAPLVGSSESASRVLAWQKGWHKALLLYLLPLVPASVMLRPQSVECARSPGARFIPAPDRPHEWKFADEQEAAGQGGLAGRALAALVPVLVAVLAAWTIKGGYAPARLGLVGFGSV